MSEQRIHFINRKQKTERKSYMLLLTAAAQLLKQVLYFIPLSGVLTRRGLKWYEGTEGETNKSSELNGLVVSK